MKLNLTSLVIQELLSLLNTLILNGYDGLVGVFTTNSVPAEFTEMTFAFDLPKYTSFSDVVVLKPDPVMVTWQPASPLFGATEEILCAFVVPTKATTRMIDLINAFITFCLNACKLT